jgi:hypothetical protein
VASIEAVREEFIGKMQAMFRAPFGVDHEAAIAEYVDVLREYDRVHLDKAWKWIRSNYKKRDWPTLPEINEALANTRTRSAIAAADSDQDIKDWLKGLGSFERVKVHSVLAKFTDHEGVVRMYAPADPRFFQAVRDNWDEALNIVREIKRSYAEWNARHEQAKGGNYAALTTAR